MRRISKLSGSALVAAAAISIGGLSMAGVPAGGATSPNLILNGNAEASPGSPTGAVVPVPDWKVSTGGPFTAVTYGAHGGFPTVSSPGPSKRGKNFFAGGPVSPNVVATQTISLAAYRAEIKTGTATYVLKGFLGGQGPQNDQAFVEVDWKMGTSVVGTSAVLGPVTAAQRGNVTGLLAQSASGKVPKQATEVFVQLSLSQVTGPYNNAYADNLSLTVS